MGRRLKWGRGQLILLCHSVVASSLISFFPIVDILFETLDICSHIFTSVPKKRFCSWIRPLKGLQKFRRKVSNYIQTRIKFGQDPLTDL